MNAETDTQESTFLSFLLILVVGYGARVTQYEDRDEYTVTIGDAWIRVLVTPRADMYLISDGTTSIGGVGRNNAERHIRDWISKVAA